MTQTPIGRFAYITRLLYPDPSAAALQSIRMAAALSEHLPTDYFVHGLKQPEAELRQDYGIPNSHLHLHSLEIGRLPRFLYQSQRYRSTIYNTLVYLQLLQQKTEVIFVRSQLEALWWGQARTWLPPLKQWRLVYEMHSPFVTTTPHITDYTPQQRRYIRAWQRYDLVLSVNQILADDIIQFTQGQVQPMTLRLCSGLPRLPQAPVPRVPTDTIKLGYVGSIDTKHGIETLLEAMKHLPSTYELHLVGHVFEDAQAWKAQVQADPTLAQRIRFHGKVPYEAVTAYLDEFDVLLLPSGPNQHSERYRSPLKLFDYMMRGKPIVAADVAAHREIIQQEHNGVLYADNQPQALAQTLQDLIAQPRLMAQVAQQAWLDGAQYTYQNRAQRLLELIQETRGKHHVR